MTMIIPTGMATTITTMITITGIRRNEPA
jgi:hypothetical protein